MVEHQVPHVLRELLEPPLRKSQWVALAAYVTTEWPQIWEGLSQQGWVRVTGALKAFDHNGVSIMLKGCTATHEVWHEIRRPSSRG